MEETRLSCLKATKSPFVLEGLHSPVKWWGWCREAFEAARALDRPVLVDVGAVWCHWCHVMDETTYSDPEVASFINEHFIPIKVDRDERPDVDRRLQEMAQLVSGQSGWPLTVFTTPGGEVIWAATYLPPRDMGRAPGMLTALKAVLEAYRERRSDIAKFAEELRSEVAAWHSPAPGEPERGIQLELLAALASGFDAENGGFGGAPKFPPITQLELLLTRYFYDGVGLYRRMAEATLDAMALGGVYDHLLGGFFRYSTDRMWLIPHYEKLLIDNAELLAIYAEAYAIFGKPLYLRTARGITAWFDEFMRRPGGGYHASQDADVEGEEGGYYRWALDELKEAAGDLWPLAVEHFGLLDVEWPRARPRSAWRSLPRGRRRRSCIGGSWRLGAGGGRRGWTRPCTPGGAARRRGASSSRLGSPGRATGDTPWTPWISSWPTCGTGPGLRMGGGTGPPSGRPWRRTTDTASWRRWRPTAGPGR